MPDVTRRDVLIAFGVTGALTPALAQHVHQTMLEAKSLDPGAAYKTKYLNAHEYLTLRKLADYILPGANDAGAAEFIDFLSSRNQTMADTCTGGLAWVDYEMQRLYGAAFIAAKAEEQTALLDVISYRKNATEQNAAGVKFFNWCRGMVIDAYYTSPIGIKEIGFMGNGVLSSFSVPDEAVQYALNRSPFAE